MKSYYRIIFLALVFTASFAVIEIWGNKIANPKISALATIKSGDNSDTPQETFQTPVINKPYVSEIAANGIFPENSSSSIRFSSEGACSNVELTSRETLVGYLNQNIRQVEINSSDRWPIASLTKLITAVVAAENIDPGLPIVLTDKNLKAEGDVGNFKGNQTYTAGDLIKAALMLSSNDAAIALSDAYGSDNFLSRARDKIKEIGMSETSVYEPTGLSSKNQSTPRDIVKLMRYLYDYHPEILKITRTSKSIIRDVKTRAPKTLTNINQFAGRSDFIGGKTGYIDASGENLVSLFSVRSQPVVIILFGSQDRFGETQKILECI